MTFVAGVDGGGTRMRAVILGPAGREVGRAETEGAVVTGTDPDRAALAVGDAVRAAVRRADVELPLDALWAGLAGAGQAAARKAVGERLARAGLAARIGVGTDLEAAFYDAFADGPGVLLISGTGSVAFGRSPNGEVAVVGGWGHLLGDEGSGYAIGLAALRSVARAADGRAEATSLGDVLSARLGLLEARALVAWAEGASKADVASLVPVVSEAAAAGDGVAREILDGAAQDLERHVVTVLERTGPWAARPTVVLSGGLLLEGRPLRSRMTRALGTHGLEIAETVPDAALGAAKIALQGRFAPHA